MLVFNEDDWDRLSMYIEACKLPLNALRLADQDAPTLPFVAEAYYKILREAPLQLEAKVRLERKAEQKELLLKTSSDIVTILKKRYEDLVTPMARAAAHVNPKYVYSEDPFICEKSGDCFQAVVDDYVNGTFQGSDIDKADLKTNMVLEAAHFRSKRGWFATDIASRVARTKSECEFWVVAGETQGLDELLEEVCLEVGCIFDSSDDEF